MAATRGVIRSERSETSRLGHRYIEARADTWRTFATVTTWADGHCTVKIVRDGATVHEFELGPEGGDK